jgi:hypothetical protein
VSEDERLSFLLDTVAREVHHLQATDARLFTQAFDVDRALALRSDQDDSERTDAFVMRFGRLQDTLGDKLLPVYLRALGEPVGAAIDNLDRAERLGLFPSAQTWTGARKLRNQMVHDYVRDPVLLAEALNRGHTLVPMLAAVVQTFLDDSRRRGWLPADPAAN